MPFLAAQRFALARAAAMVRDRPGAFLLGASLTSLAIALPLMLASIGVAVWPLAARVQPAAELSVFVATRATPRDVETLKSRLAQQPGVVAVTVRNKDEALAQLARQSGFAGLPAELGPNPLPDVLIAQIAPTMAPATLDSLVSEARQWPQVDVVRSDLDWYRKLHAVAKLLAVALALFGTVALLLLTLVLLGAVRLHATTRADEIALLRLSGATRRFIVRPYAYSAALTLLTAAVAATALVYLAHAALRAPLAELSALYGARFALQDPEPLFAAAVWVGALLLGWAIGAIGAGASLDRDH